MLSNGIMPFNVHSSIWSIGPFIGPFIWSIGPFIQCVVPLYAEGTKRDETLAERMTHLKMGDSAVVAGAAEAGP